MLSFGVVEWSRVWPLQPFFRLAGGYFVRHGKKDPHYRLLLKRYVQITTEARVPHAAFIQGQLSNDRAPPYAQIPLPNTAMPPALCDVMNVPRPELKKSLL